MRATSLEQACAQLESRFAAAGADPQRAPFAAAPGPLEDGAGFGDSVGVGVGGGTIA